MVIFAIISDAKWGRAKTIIIGEHSLNCQNLIVIPLFIRFSSLFDRIYVAHIDYEKSFTCVF